MNTFSPYSAAEAYAEALFSDGVVKVRDTMELMVVDPDGATSRYEAEFQGFDSIGLTEIKEPG